MMLPFMPAATCARDALGAQQHLAKVGPVECVPALLGRVEERRIKSAAGVVDEDRGRAAFGDRPRQRGVDRIRIAHIGDDAEYTERVSRIRAGLGVDFPDHHRSAECGEPGGDATADAGAATGDDSDAAVQQAAGGIDGHSGLLVFAAGFVAISRTALETGEGPGRVHRNRVATGRRHPSLHMDVRSLACSGELCPALPRSRG